MKPSEECKRAGLKSLAELSEMTETSVQTLNNWSKNKPKLFDVLLAGASIIKRRLMGKYYVVQHGYGVFGEGDSEVDAIVDAKNNGCEFDKILHIIGYRNSGSCRPLMTENGELLIGQIVVVSAEQYQEHYSDDE